MPMERSPLLQIIANVAMNDLEKTNFISEVVDKVGIYQIFVDDTVLSAKPEHFKVIFN